MKNILLYGNCQLQKLQSIFASLLSGQFRVRALQQVQEITDFEYFTKNRELIANSDILIIQNISSKRLDPFVTVVPFLPAGAKVILIDSIYCSFFHPELLSSNSIPAFKVGRLHDRYILEAAAFNVPVEQFLLEDPFLSESFFDDNYLHIVRNLSFNALLERQLSARKKLEMASFKYRHIEFEQLTINALLREYSTFKRELWGDFNHPHNEVYRYLVGEICRVLGIDFYAEQFDEKYSASSNDSPIKRPVYGSIIRGYSFDPSTSTRNYRLTPKYKDISRERYVRDVYEHYLKLDKTILIDNLTDHYREIALSFEKLGAIEDALKLMKQAKKFRPNGPFINGKIASYEDRLCS